MADSDKQILITPNVSQTAQPEIKFVGKDNSPMYLKVLDDNTLSFEGVEGQAFSISPTMSTGTIFSVNDISGVPSITVDADGTITLAPYQDGNIGIGMTSPTAALHITSPDTAAEAFRVDVTDTDSTADSTPFVIDGDGRVGIGTASPVAGSALTLNGDGTTYEGIVFQSGGSTKWKMSTDASAWYHDSQVNSLNYNIRLRDPNGDYQIFHLDADTAGTLKAGIGTNSPSFTSGGGLQIVDAAQANLRVTDSTSSTSSDFAQSNNDLYIVNRTTNGDIKIRVNSSNELITLDGGDQTVLMGATSMGDADSKVGISGKLRIGDIANTQDGTTRAYLHVDSGTEDPGGTSGDFVRLSTLMMDGGSGGNNVMYTTYALRNDTGTDWQSLSIVDGVRVDTNAEVLKANGVTGSNLRMWHEIDAMDAKRHWGHVNTIGMTYHHTDNGRLGIGTTSPAFKLDVNGYIATTDGFVHTGDTNNTITFGTDTQSFNTGSIARMNISDSGLQIGTGARVTTILDEDAMGSNSATALATQQSIKAYVDTNVMSLANDGNNRVVTATGSGSLNGEANMTFTGSALNVTGTATFSGLMTAGSSSVGSYHIVNAVNFITRDGDAINGSNTTAATAEGATYRFSSSHILAGTLANGSDVELFRFNVTNASYRKMQGGKMYVRIQDTATGGFFQETVTFAYTGDGTTPVIYSSTDRLDSQMAGTQSSYDHEKATILVEFVTDHIRVKFSNDTGSSIATSGWDARVTCTLFDMEAISL